MDIYLRWRIGKKFVRFAIKSLKEYERLLGPDEDQGMQFRFLFDIFGFCPLMHIRFS